MNYALLSTEVLTAVIGLTVLVAGLILPQRGKKVVGILAMLMTMLVLVVASLHFTDYEVFLVAFIRSMPMGAFLRYFSCRRVF